MAVIEGKLAVKQNWLIYQHRGHTTAIATVVIDQAGNAIFYNSSRKLSAKLCNMTLALVKRAPDHRPYRRADVNRSRQHMLAATLQQLKTSSVRFRCQNESSMGQGRVFKCEEMSSKKEQCILCTLRRTILGTVTSTFQSCGLHSKSEALRRIISQTARSE